jgi:predicted RNA-binding Zn-ribbon protein involved in translation (DUF1610 family)
MSEGEIKKCVKCGGEMDIGHLDGATRWVRGRDYLVLRIGDRIWGYKCKNCGYVEFYAESKKEKEKTSRVSNGSRMVR